LKGWDSHGAEARVQADRGWSDSEDWAVKPFGIFVTALEAGVSVNSVDQETITSTHDRSILKTSCVIAGRFIPEERKTIAPRDILRAKQPLRKDTIVISRMNTPALVGECGYIDQNYPDIFLPDRLWMTRHDLRLPHSVRWLAYLLSFRPFSRAIKECATGTSGSMKNISKHSLLEVQIPMPPTKAEQEAIAGALSDADALIESLEQLLAKKRQIKQGAMQELLTGKKRLPGFAVPWGTKHLGDVADTDPENLGSETSPTFSFNYISLEDVDRGTLRNYCEQIFQSAPSRARRKLRKNDVIVSTVRPNLQSHFLFPFEDVNWVCSTGFCVVRCRSGMTEPHYLYFHLFSEGVTRQIEALLTGSNYPAINSGDVRALQIPFPAYKEQTAIAAVLSDMDAEIAALETKLVKAHQLKQGMMQELLTGRIRLV